jgi:putative serine protease PepD
VAGAPHEFDDAFDDDERGPLLPPEDRVWRHPSEMSAGAVANEVHEARDRWLTSTPTRAGAWSAGLVGAVLATGVVLGGTHLTNWLGKASPRQVTMTAAATTLQPADTVLPPLTDKICAAVHASLAVVKVESPHGTMTGDGVVLAANGMILVPMSLVAGASSTSGIEVTTDDGEVFAGWVLGTDAATDLAVIKIGTDSLTPLVAAPNSDVSADEFLAVEWSTLPHADSWLSMGTVTSPEAISAEPGNFELLDNLGLHALHLENSPVGSVLLNADGQLLGMVIKRNGNHVVEAPGKLAEQVGEQIARYGHVTHGWLGIAGRSTDAFTSTKPSTQEHPTASRSALPAGVEVTSVGTGTSAAMAGLRAGDVIEAVNGSVVDSMQALQVDLYTLRPNAAVRLTIDRGSSIRTVSARLQAAA